MLCLDVKEKRKERKRGERKRLCLDEEKNGRNKNIFSNYLVLKKSEKKGNFIQLNYIYTLIIIEYII